MRRALLSAVLLTLASGAAGCGVLDIASVEGTAPPAVVAEERCRPELPQCVDTPSEGAGDEPIMAPDIPVVDAFVHDPEPRLITPEPDGAGETFPLFLQEAMVDGTTLRVSFSGGHAPCFVVATAEAVERADAVIVNVRAGTADGTDQASCSTVVEMQQVEIALADELGDRLLLDGSRVFQGDGDVTY